MDCEAIGKVMQQITKINQNFNKYDEEIKAIETTSSNYEQLEHEYEFYINFQLGKKA